MLIRKILFNSTWQKQNNELGDDGLNILLILYIYLFIAMKNNRREKYIQD